MLGLCTWMTSSTRAIRRTRGSTAARLTILSLLQTPAVARQYLLVTTTL